MHVDESGSPTGSNARNTGQTTDSVDFFSVIFTNVFGSDGSGSASIAYSLATARSNSGLVDTLNVLDVMRAKNGGDVVGVIDTSGADLNGLETMFRIEVDAPDRRGGKQSSDRDFRDGSKDD